MEHDYFPQNLRFLIDNGEIDVKTILNITGNNSPGLITMWKNGIRQITTKDLVAIANYLNLTVDDLINKDLAKKENSNPMSKTDILYNKTKNILSDDDRATIESIMNRTIEKYEKSKKKETD